MLVQLDRETRAVLAAAAADRPATTSDLLTAVLATRYTPAARLMRTLGLSTDTLRRYDGTETGRVVLPAGPAVTTTLAKAVTDAQLDGASTPVDPIRLLVAMLNNPECDAVAMLSTTQVPAWRLLARLRAEQRQHMTVMSYVDLGRGEPGPVARSLRNLALVQFGLIGVPGLAALYGLVWVFAATDEGWPALPVLVGLALVLSRLPSGWPVGTVAMLLACLFLFAGLGLTADMESAGDVIGILAGFGLLFLLGIAWCVRSGIRRRLRAAIAP